MKYTILKLAVLVGMIGFSGCTDFMDTTPTDRVSDKMIWQDEASANLYLNTFYAYIDRYGVFGNAQFNSNLTEGLTNTFKYGSVSMGALAGDANYYVFNPALISPDQNLLGTWGATYERIRRINEFLSTMQKYSTFSTDVNAKLEAQARFFRAFLYFQLAKRHGGVILYTDLNMSKNKNRSTKEETYDLIEKDLDYAASVLPKAWGAENRGRITKGAAFAFKSRAMLYAERWDKVKASADSVFNLQMYSLTDAYADAWKGGNSEAILEYEYLRTGPSHGFDKSYAPFGEIENGGGSGTPTQEMVESYEKADGTRVDWTPWHVAGGTTVRPPYENLEPRFQATVIYNGCEWKGSTMENSVGGTKGRFLEYGNDPYCQGKTTTGYYLRKLMDETHTDYTYNSDQSWVEIRLAEVYLNRAEANFRLGNTGAALADMNAVRTRPGVGLPAKSGLAGEDLMAAIRQERKIELAYEGHLYWDMRRWKLAHKEYNNYRCHGMKIASEGADNRYEYVDCDFQDRKFLEKTYVLPIPSSELSNNSGIEQYDEWK